MKLPDLNKVPRLSLKPGEYHATKQKIILSTLFGSCVSACLYDPCEKVAGMNHFVLSNRRYAKHMSYCETEAGRYGIHAMELLISQMMHLGAKRENLHAKVFGGSSLLQPSEGTDNFFCVGSVNSRFILDFPKNEGMIPAASDLGGNEGGRT